MMEEVVGIYNLWRLAFGLFGILVYSIFGSPRRQSVFTGICYFSKDGF